MFQSRLLSLTFVLCVFVSGGAHAADEGDARHPGADKAPGHFHSAQDADDSAMPRRCRHHDPRMGGMPAMIAIPQLPSGNAKLQLQMHAEILQKVGEIMAKYAGQVQDPTAPH